VAGIAWNGFPPAEKGGKDLHLRFQGLGLVKGNEASFFEWDQGWKELAGSRMDLPKGWDDICGSAARAWP
jgi:hypothetical protein